MISKREIKNSDTIKDERYWYDVCVVSIWSRDSWEFKWHAKNFIRLKFDDVSFQIDSKKKDILYHYKVMSDNDAYLIAEFISHYNKMCSKIIFQCEAWVSRSVGCCEAFLSHYFWSEVENRFINEKPFWNPFVKKTLLDAFKYWDKENVQSN